MRFTIVVAVVFSLSAATAFGQQPSGRSSPTPRPEQRRESDSTFIAREWEAWNALKDADSARVVRALGHSPSLLMLSSGGLVRTSAARFAGAITKCDTRRHRLDMFNVDHPTEDTAILTYRVMLDRRCGSPVGPWSNLHVIQQMAMTVWVRRNGRWEAAAQSLVALNVGADLK